MSMFADATRCFLALALLLLPAVVRAEKPPPCPPLTSFAEPRIIPANVASNEVGLTFIGHATFLI